MRLRRLGVVAVAILAIAGLAGCRSNVGTAAIVDGHRISESDVSRYVTSKSQAVPSGAASIPPRSFVLATLIDMQVFVEIVAKTPGLGPLGEGAIAKRTAQLLGGQSMADVARIYEQHGYPVSFADVAVRTQVFVQVVNDAAKQGTDVQSVVDSLHLTVSVNPRYGTWDAKQLSLTSTPGSGVPSFVDIGVTSVPVPTVSATPPK